MSAAASCSTWNIQPHSRVIHQVYSDVRYPVASPPPSCCSLGLSLQELFCADASRKCEPSPSPCDCHR